MHPYTYQSIRIGEKVRRHYLGPDSDPHAQLFSRQRRLDDAMSDTYMRDAKKEQRQYLVLEIISSISKDSLERSFIAELESHGYTRTLKQGLTRMSAPVPTPPQSPAPESKIDSPPKITQEALQAFLTRVRDDDQDALVELEALVANDISPFSIDVNFLAIAKEEFHRLVSRTDGAAKAFVADSTEKLIRRFTENENTPMGIMLLEHMQFFVLVSQYNCILNLSPARSSRERTALLKRSSEANLQVLAIWKMYREYKALSTSDWTQMPSELSEAHAKIIETVFQV